MINLGVVAVIRVVGVRGDPCGAMRWYLSIIRFRIFTKLTLITVKTVKGWCS